ncbi:MAG: ABC transporter ATP-binding protein, partial [Ruminococcaceae bacterium]|nr:ABC transporter ATP-binding protein [Oscillospiraceae bacterium]
MIKKLLSCVGEYKKSSLLAPFFVSLEVVIEVIIPLLMAQIIDFGIKQGDMGYVLKLGSLLVLSALLSLCCGALSGKHASIASAGFAKNIRKRLFHDVQEFSFSNIDKFSTASVVTRLTTDVTHLQNAYQMLIRGAVRSPFMLTFSVIMTVTIHPKMSLIFLSVIPILGIGLFFLMSRAHPVFEWVFKTYDKLNNVVQENLRGIRVVKSFVREEYETKKFEEVSQSIFEKFSFAERLLAFNAPLMQFCVYTCMILLSWFGAKFIVTSGETVLTRGELTSLFTYIMQILMSLMMLSMIFVMIIISRASAERIVEIMSEESDIKNPEHPVMEVKNGDIRFSDVDFAYKKKGGALSLKKINLDIKSGEVVGILGGTGSSKSTLVQLIPRLYDVSTGSVSVGGVDVRDYDLTVLRDAVSFVLQKNELFAGTILENLRWGNENATEEECVHACRLAQADDFIRQFPDGYHTHIEQGGTNVSGGQKQRLC